MFVYTACLWGNRCMCPSVCLCFIYLQWWLLFRSYMYCMLSKQWECSLYSPVLCKLLPFDVCLPTKQLIQWLCSHWVHFFHLLRCVWHPCFLYITTQIISRNCGIFYDPGQQADTHKADKLELETTVKATLCNDSCLSQTKCKRVSLNSHFHVESGFSLLQGSTNDYILT